MNYTPPNLKQEAILATENSLSAVSKVRYMKTLSLLLFLPIILSHVTRTHPAIRYFSTSSTMYYFSNMLSNICIMV